MNLRGETVGLVEEHGGNALRRKSDFIADNAGDIDRMLDERMAVPAKLPVQTAFGDVPRPRNQGAAFSGVFSEEFIKFCAVNHKLLFSHKKGHPNTVWTSFITCIR